MDYTEIGFSKFLERGKKEITRKLSPNEIDILISEMAGEKIAQYTGDNFNFIPTNPKASPKQGDVFYDKEAKKLKVYTGSAYEIVTSA